MQHGRPRQIVIRFVPDMPRCRPRQRVNATFIHEMPSGSPRQEPNCSFLKYRAVFSAEVFTRHFEPANWNFLKCYIIS